MRTNALSIATACAFNTGMLSFQVQRRNRPPAEIAFLRGERCAYRRLTKVLLRRLEHEDHKTILAGFRDGWMTARTELQTKKAA